MDVTRRQIGSLIITNPDLLPLVREIIWDQQEETLTAVAISPLGGEQQFIHFLEAGPGESKPLEPCKTATNVDGDECREFLQAVEAASGYPLSNAPVYLRTEGSRSKEKGVLDANVLVWHSNAPEPPASGQTPPPVSAHSDPGVE
jgi:hypothetical protein